MKNNSSLLYNLSLVVADIVALVLSFAGAFIIRSLSPVDVAHPMHGTTYLAILTGLLPFWILIFGMLGLYGTAIHERRFSEAGRLLVGAFAGMLFMVFWDYMSSETIFPAKSVPIYSFVLAFFLLLFFRTIIRAIRSFLFGYGVGRTHIVIVGNTPTTEELIQSLSETNSGYAIVAVVGYRKKLPEGIQYFPNFDSFLASGDQNIHSIIQTEMYAEESRNTEILAFAQENHASYRFIPGNSEMFVGNMDVDLFRNSIPVIHVHHTPLFGWGRLVKRLTDVVLGSVMLFIASPFIALISLFMAVFDHGDPIFRQKRLSRFGNEIGVYKFRTYLHAYNRMSPEEGFAKMGRPELAKKYRENGDFLEDDPRISRIGRFLRATSLDELPQLWNVVKGDMSLVGPRPLEPFELKNFDKKSLMLSVKTGLTGLAVVSGRRDIPFEERRKLDLYYVQNWSFWMDMVILLKTARAVLMRTGAR